MLIIEITKKPKQEVRNMSSNRKIHISLILILCLGVLFSVAYAQGNWIEKATAPAAGGYGQAIVSTDNYIYLARGMYASSEPEFYRYDPKGNSWRSLSTENLPQGAFRNGTALAWDGKDAIYALLGARYEDRHRTLFYRYSISEDTWLELKPTPHVQGAGNAITWSGYDNKLYAFVGSTKHGSAFIAYDIEEMDWITKGLNLPSFCNRTDDGASLVWTGDVYLYGLFGEYDEGRANGVFVRYNLDTKSWKKLNSIPEVSSGKCSCITECGVGDGASLLWAGHLQNNQSNYIYALGGGCVNAEPGNSFYLYDLLAKDWQNLGNIPCPIGWYNGNRFGFANGHIYYWQGSPTTERWKCGGDAFYMYQNSH